ncbi:MAG: hypothetical protein IJS69_05835, partial [Selenomonadaceae bacterium]|nr:hypothetical protein [Selenomonadaceae bacterium]
TARVCIVRKSLRSFKSAAILIKSKLMLNPPQKNIFVAEKFFAAVSFPATNKINPVEKNRRGIFFIGA